MMRRWLQGFLDISDSCLVRVEFCDGVPGNCCLYYLGQEELERQSNLQGSAWVKNRCRFLLRRLSIEKPDSGAAAAWFHNLEDWALQQSAQGSGPTLSKLPGSTVRVENAHRSRLLPDGTTEYEAQLLVDYEDYGPEV